MKIKVVKNNKPEFENINFACDNILSSKLEAYPLARDNLNKFNTTLIVGKQGSGKTHLTLNILKKLYKKVFHKIYLFMPPSSRASIKNSPFDALPDDQIYDELNYETILDVYERIKQNKDDGLKSLVIFDDVQKALKDHQVLLSLKNIIANQRHLNVVNIILVQNYYALDRSLRELINNLIFFKVDKSQSEKIFKECIELNYDDYLKINDFIFDKLHNFCFINLNTKRIYKNWDEIILNPEIDENYT